MRWESDSMGRSKESVSISMIGVCSMHIGLNLLHVRDTQALTLF